jgi:uncharacterized protein with GYD domain
MIFVTLARWRKKPTKEMVAQAGKLFEQQVKEGARILGQYWTLGRYDAVVIIEGKDEKAAMKAALRWDDLISTETMVAVTREEAIKLIE